MCEKNTEPGYNRKRDLKIYIHTALSDVAVGNKITPYIYFQRYKSTNLMGFVTLSGYPRL